MKISILRRRFFQNYEALTDVMPNQHIDQAVLQQSAMMYDDYELQSSDENAR